MHNELLFVRPLAVDLTSVSAVGYLLQQILLQNDVFLTQMFPHHLCHPVL